MQGLKDQVEEWTSHDSPAPHSDPTLTESMPEEALRSVVVPAPEGRLTDAATAAPDPVTELSAPQGGVRLSAGPGKALVRVWLAALGLAIIGVAVIDQASTPLPPPAPPFKADLPQSSPIFVPLASASTKPGSTISLSQGSAGAKTGQSPANAGTPPAGSGGVTDTSPARQSGTNSSTSKPGRSSPTVGGGSSASAPPDGGASSTPILVLPASPSPQLVAVDTGVLGIPVALNVGACTGLQLGPLSLGCTSPSAAAGSAHS